MLKHYILGRSLFLCRNALASAEEQIEPAVAPRSELRHLDDKMELILSFRDKALATPDFESFIKLLDEVVAVCGLSPAEDTTEVAAILNRMRVDAGLMPL